jgi:transcriptional regulator with XRE-family HTH domain
MSLVRRKREEAGLTQTEVAKRAHMTGSKLSKIESGALKLKVDDVLVLARALGCKPSELIPDLEEEPASAPCAP